MLVVQNGTTPHLFYNNKTSMDEVADFTLFPSFTVIDIAMSSLYNQPNSASAYFNFYYWNLAK
jgi:hypothetical protein